MKQKHERRDAYWLSDIDSMHKFMPYLLPNRADNEAVGQFAIDLTEANSFLKEKNVEGIDFKYTLFHLITAAIAKTVALRPKMNRFVAGHRLYERKDIIIAFTCKKTLDDKGAEGLVKFKVNRGEDSNPLQEVHDLIQKQVTGFRKENKTDGATDIMDTLTKLPRWLLKIVVAVLRFLDYNGIMPESISREDPYYSTVFISNLGSIKMSASYHHLTNWGTNSFFVCIGEKRIAPIFAPDGSYEMKEQVDLAFTVDERIADGVYYAGSFRLLKYLLEHPALLEKPIMEVPDDVRI
ncbi:MAG: hypothetical protein E7655_05055 [Ruminococcaceae bacterium]|nr:hypothetical protein [Oscillospiraceae bacterium]